MKVLVIGMGYVGLPTATVLALLGHDVIAVDSDTTKIVLLQDGRSPIQEAGVEEALSVAKDRLTFTTPASGSAGTADVIFIAVGTPQGPGGVADMRAFDAAVGAVASDLLDGRAYTLVIKSTVPVGTNQRVIQVVARELERRHVFARVAVVSNPEFLREGRAMFDTLYPDRIVVGAQDRSAAEVMRELYQPILDGECPSVRDVEKPGTVRIPRFLVASPASAELTKYAANAFLAIKISFINEIATLAEQVNADVGDVAEAVGLDSRIGPAFLEAGLGWGGSCLPKDTAALSLTGLEFGTEMALVQAAIEVNERQRTRVVRKLEGLLGGLMGRTIAVWGLSFKPGTDDLRDSPAIELIKLLASKGAKVRMHDPVALDKAQGLLEGLSVVACPSADEATDGADALVIATAWSEYGAVDWHQVGGHMATRILVDTRNQINPDNARSAGFSYTGVGRG